MPVRQLPYRWFLVRHWAWLAVIAVLVVLLALSPDAGVLRWIAVVILIVVVFLACIYGLVRFVMWAARNRRDR
jgi:hypothetical protein